MAIPPPPTLLALMRPSSRFIKDLPLAVRQLRCSWYMVFQLLPGISERASPRLIPRLWAYWSPGYDAHDDLVDVLAALQGPGRATAALRYYRALLLPWMRQRKYAAEQSHWNGVPRVPVLYLHGEQDGCMLATIARRAGAALPPGSEVEILPGVGHFPQLERPDAVNERIAAFIEAP
jgi:pimeloyl-ACP methyl ester carboxylesterase